MRKFSGENLSQNHDLSRGSSFIIETCNQPLNPEIDQNVVFGEWSWVEHKTWTMKRVVCSIQRENVAMSGQSCMSAGIGEELVE